MANHVDNVKSCQTNAARLFESDPHQLSSHILDVTRGIGAKNVEVHLYKQDMTNSSSPLKSWILSQVEITDENGRIKTFLERKTNPNCGGIYKLVFFTEPYFQNLNEETFYPHIEVVFNLSSTSHYHVPITLSNFGYSTYRGN